MTAPTATRPSPTDGPFRLRLAGAMTVSLVVHALIISLQFGLPGIGLPALELPWRERRTQSVDLQVVLAPPAAGAGAEAAPPATPPVAGSAPPAGLRLVPLPPAPVPKAGMKPGKSKPAARRASRPRIKRETPVIALNDTRNSRFNMPAPAADEVLPLPLPEPEAEPPAPAPEVDSAAQEHEQAALRQAEEEKALRAREAEELATQQQQQAEAIRRQEEAARERALAEQNRRQDEAKQREEARLALEEQRKAEESSRVAAALALQREREEMQRREREDASRRRLELEEMQRAETLRLQEERAQREAMELQAKKQAEAAEAAEAARQQAAARERERQAEELAARKKAEMEAAAPTRERGPDLVLGDNPAPGTRIDALPRALGSGLAGRAIEQARRGDVLRNDVPVARDTGNAAEPPRRRSFLGGKDIDVGVMMYVESWRLKIERNGSIMYPRAAVDKAQGDPVVTVAVRSDGSVENVVVHRSSGRAELDEAVHRIVRVNARYSAFPPELARRFDVIEIRKVWNFDDRLRILEEVR